MPCHVSFKFFYVRNENVIKKHNSKIFCQIKCPQNVRNITDYSSPPPPQVNRGLYTPPYYLIVSVSRVWNSMVGSCLSFIFVCSRTLLKSFSLLNWFTFCHAASFYSLLYDVGFDHCWRPIHEHCPKVVCILVCCNWSLVILLSNQIPHLHIFILSCHCLI